MIERCLAAITGGARPGELQVIVVCNGCDDDTAERARRHGEPVSVVETEVASKHVALNLGVELPLNDKARHDWRAQVFLIWDFADGGFFEGW